VWDPIRQRIQSKGSRLRSNDASFLVYALMDAIVDHCFPILEHYGDLLEDLEDDVLANPQRTIITSIHKIKRDLLMMRRAAWPMREVISFYTESRMNAWVTSRGYTCAIFTIISFRS